MSALPIIIAVLVGLIVYVAGILVIPKNVVPDSTSFTRKQLKGLAYEGADDEPQTNDNLMRDRQQSTGILAQIYYVLPLGKFSHQYLVRGGMAASVDKLFLICVGVFLATLVLLPVMNATDNGVIVIISAIAAAYFVGWRIIKGSMKSRIKKFTNQFPDALDIIVRSVKSGFPLNAAVNMVAESMQAPASEEFKQVSTEVNHGSTLVEALGRLGQRMQTPDINFFVVVLTLQQEVGGSLAEVLNNLSGLIRKRKMMVRKVHAITSEGRFTGWVLGSLPLLVAIGIHVMDPKYLLPLFTTSSGHMILGITVVTILIGIGIIRKMVDMEI
ncbi:MAG: type II secretion system F family protein [Rickettsiales bacterium]|jgi:tight adherence protein B